MAVIKNIPLDLHLSSAHSWVTFVLFLIVPLILSTLATRIYKAYFDNLSHIPGPKLWVAFPILRYIAGIRGELDPKLREWHAKHGKAVRFSDHEVSFNVGQGWADIYGFKNSPELPKPSTRREPGRPTSIITSNNADHSRMRRALAHGFSDRALREQESLMQSYINMLVSQLSNMANSQEPTNMVRWLNFTTFDIIGDLSFGKSFGCLATGGYHWFIENNLKVIQSGPYVQLTNNYPMLRKIVAPFIAPDLMKARDGMFDYARTTVTERLNNESQKGRWDFVDALTKDDIVKGEELVGNSVTLIFAGSETTATVLSGVTYYLLKNPRVKDKVVAEVRSTFKDESEINLVNVNSILPYLNAVLEEGLRIYPPVPSGLSRATTHDMMICDVPVPKGTHVMTHQTAIHWSETNFTRPKEFIPERWLPEAKKPGSEFYNDDRSAVQPFAVGPRNCIGKNLANSEMRLILARLLWNFDFELCPESDNWNDQRSFTLWEKPDLMCRVKLSEKTSAV